MSMLRGAGTRLCARCGPLVAVLHLGLASSSIAQSSAADVKRQVLAQYGECATLSPCRPVHITWTLEQWVAVDPKQLDAARRRAETDQNPATVAEWSHLEAVAGGAPLVSRRELWVESNERWRINFDDMSLTGVIHQHDVARNGDGTWLIDQGHLLPSSSVRQADGAGADLTIYSNDVRDAYSRILHGGIGLLEPLKPSFNDPTALPDGMWALAANGSGGQHIEAIVEWNVDTGSSIVRKIDLSVPGRPDERTTVECSGYQPATEHGPGHARVIEEYQAGTLVARITVQTATHIDSGELRLIVAMPSSLSEDLVRGGLSVHAPAQLVADSSHIERVHTRWVAIGGTLAVLVGLAFVLKKGRRI